MIIVKLLVPDKLQGDIFAKSLLDKKYTLNVFGNHFESYYLNSLGVQEHRNVYVIQFLTKSMLFNEIEEGLKHEFPTIDFSICATPVVHLAVQLHDKIRQRVNGRNLIDEETEN